MLYYVIHEPSSLQFFDSRWTATKHVIQDIDTIMTLFDITNIQEVVICGKGIRYKIEYDQDNEVILMYNGKHFHCDVSFGNSYLMPKHIGDTSSLIISNKQLTELIGQDINL